MPFFTEDIKQGVKSFTELNDTPESLIAGQTVRANAAGTALEFYVPSGGGGGSSIDDSNVSTTTTYSSSKIVTELGTKANTSALNSYLPLAGGALTGDVTTNVANGSFSATSLVSKNYVDNAVGGASGATTYTALTDTPATHAANAILYSTGSAIAHTTTQIAIDGNGVEVNQLNARVDGTSNIGDSSHKFNTVFSGAVHQGNVKLVIPTTRGTTGQYVKVANANAEEHTLEFADVINDAAASSSSTYSSSKIDSTYLQQSKVKNSASTTAGDVYDVRHVDSQLGNKADVTALNSYLPLAGGGLTGHVTTTQTNFSTNNQLVNKQYTDTKVASLINDSIYRNYLVWSSTKTRETINGLIDDSVYRTTNVWSSTKTRNEIQTAVANLVDSAPTALDTLNELAAALGDDPNFATTVTNSIATKLPLAGGALTGNVTTNLANNAFTATSLVSKNYVDNAVGGVGGATTFTALTDTPSTFTNDRFLKTTGSAVVDFELNSKTLKWDFYSAIGDLPAASSNHGMLAHVHAEGAVYFAHNGNWVKIANDSRVDNSVSGIALSGADLSVTRQDGSAFLVTGVNPPALSWAVQGGTVSNNGATLQLTQTNGSPAAITGLTPSTVADGKTLTSGTYDLGAGSLAITQQDTTSITITGCPRPLSSFSAAAGSGNYYTPSFLNDRILPAVSSGTNQYVLGNDGTGPLWLSSIQGSSTTLNFGTSTLKKFVTWATGTFNEYFMKATPSNGDTLGSIFFGDTGLNYYSMLSGKVDSTAGLGHVSVSAAKSGTMTEQLVVGKSDHSSADAGQFSGTVKVAGVKFSNNLTQTKPVEDPSTVGHVLTAGAGGTWSWAAPTGGVSPTYIDIHCQVGVTTPSGATNITNNNPANESPTDRKGVSWGKRFKTFFIHEGYDFVSKYPGAGYPGGSPYNLGFLAMFNGRYAGTLLELGIPVAADSWMPYYVNEYGWFDYQSHSGHRYNFNKIAMYFYGAQPTDRSGNDYFTIYGSNDGVNFDTIANLRMQDFLTTTPTGYTNAGAGVGSSYSTVWFSFTNNNFYRIYRWQWKDFTNVVENTGTANYFRYGMFLAQNKYCAEIEFH